MLRLPAASKGNFPCAGLAAGLCLLFAAPTFGAWELDNTRSAVNFLSIKNTDTAEVHHFKSVSGNVTDDGAVELRINLDSVETLVPIRNQRMREMLFETMRFPAATLTADVPESLLALKAGESTISKVDISVAMHGKSKSYPASVVVSGLASGGLQVLLRQPLLVDAADFALAGGIGMLREVAGLASINTAVPVTAHLVFTPTED